MTMSLMSALPRFEKPCLFLFLLLFLWEEFFQLHVSKHIVDDFHEGDVDNELRFEDSAKLASID
jgi:hypothetical protein